MMKVEETFPTREYPPGQSRGKIGDIPGDECNVESYALGKEIGVM